MKNKLHLIDCMEFMKDIPDNFYNLAIVDIQYGINQGGDKNKSRSILATSKDYHSYDDSETMPQEYFTELFRVSKNQILWGANHFISKIPFDSSCWIIWDKVNGKNDFADAELSWTSFNTAVRILKYKWHGMLQEKMKNKELRIHPNQKPVDLYKWLLTNYAKPKDKILDTHSGSGSLRIACHDLGFDLDSCEIDKDYFNDNEARFKRHTCQKDLFSTDEYQDLIFKE